MAGNDKKAKNALTEVSVDTVGLVSSGANRETFFLLKSMKESEMDQTNTTVQPAAGVDEGKLVERVYERFMNLFKAQPKDQPTEVASEMAGEHEALAKANADLQLQIAKAQETAAKAISDAEEVRKAMAIEIDRRETQIYFEKASAFGRFPISAKELGEQLRFVYKQDANRGDFWTGLLKAVDAQMEDSGLFFETGTTESDEADSLAKILKMTDPKDIRDAYLNVPSKEATRIIKERRRMVKTS